MSHYQTNTVTEPLITLPTLLVAGAFIFFTGRLIYRDIYFEQIVESEQAAIITQIESFRSTHGRLPTSVEFRGMHRHGFFGSVSYYPGPMSWYGLETADDFLLECTRSPRLWPFDERCWTYYHPWQKWSYKYRNVT